MAQLAMLPTANSTSRDPPREVHTAEDEAVEVPTAEEDITSLLQLQLQLRHTDTASSPRRTDSRTQPLIRALMLPSRVIRHRNSPSSSGTLSMPSNTPSRRRTTPCPLRTITQTTPPSCTTNNSSNKLSRTAVSQGTPQPSRIMVPVTLHLDRSLDRSQDRLRSSGQVTPNRLPRILMLAEAVVVEDTVIEADTRAR